MEHIEYSQEVYATLVKWMRMERYIRFVLQTALASLTITFVVTYIIILTENVFDELSALQNIVLTLFIGSAPQISRLVFQRPSDSAQRRALKRSSSHDLVNAATALLLVRKSVTKWPITCNCACHYRIRYRFIDVKISTSTLFCDKIACLYQT